jgi:cell division protein FtsA
MDEIVVGIDVGTTKICTLVGRVEKDAIRILGVGVEPSEGIKKGIIVDLAAASQAITRSVQKAELTSSTEITGAMVSLAGAHVSSINSRGVAGVSGEVIDEYDVARALEAARAIAIPHNREVIHVIQRGFTVDGQDGISMPIGMHGYHREPAPVRGRRRSGGAAFRAQPAGLRRRGADRHRAPDGRGGL